MFERGHLAALVAVVRGGSFEAAARTEHVTPSAISQRIKQLEEQVGGVVVVRSTPCRPSPLGEPIYRHGLQVELLESELSGRLGARDETQGRGPSPPIGIAVNADSLATWVLSAIGPFVASTGREVDVMVDDQDHTANWLRSGRVLGAVTTEAQPVQGCRSQALGAMRYRANASPAFMRRYFPQGFAVKAVAAAPAIAFDRRDHLHDVFVRRALRTRTSVARVHYLPSPFAIVDACRAGLGFSLNPEPLVLEHIAKGRLVDVLPGQHLDVPLYWQQWTLASSTLAALAKAVDERARVALHGTP